MKQLSIKPTIHKFNNALDFAKEFNLKEGDLVITNKYICLLYTSPSPRD